MYRGPRLESATFADSSCKAVQSVFRAATAAAQRGNPAQQVHTEDTDLLAVQGLTGMGSPDVGPRRDFDSTVPRAPGGAVLDNSPEAADSLQEDWCVCRRYGVSIMLASPWPTSTW